ncbi:MAG: c-type cytochrome biogenesis protein CcmI, partial [Colwellia sp.]|nr:c-type cytochrome biogenesis protein CcmI [Colwellia sp.]
MEIVLISLVFIALFLFIVWRPFFKSAVNDGIHNNEKQNVRDETNVELYKEHKTEIERDFSDGAIDEENYQYLLAELDKSLLQDITAAEKMLEPSATQPSATQPSATQPSATQPSATQPSATQPS